MKKAGKEVEYILSWVTILIAYFCLYMVSISFLSLLGYISAITIGLSLGLIGSGGSEKMNPADVSYLKQLLGADKVFDFSGKNEITSQPSN